jgi:hypothetical protein
MPPMVDRFPEGKLSSCFSTSCSATEVGSTLPPPWVSLCGAAPAQAPSSANAVIEKISEIEGGTDNLGTR